MSEKPIRVKDRRMFTTDGELREEYREMAAREAEKPAEAAAQPPEAAPTAAASPAARQPAPAQPQRQAPPSGLIGSPQQAGPEPVETASGATFQDLIALLAQSASVYLQQAAHAPLEHRAESIELARMHIDLLVILKAKTQGNLDAMEQALLDDVLYRLRLAAVERA